MEADSSLRGKVPHAGIGGGAGLGGVGGVEIAYGGVLVVGPYHAAGDLTAARHAWTQALSIYEDLHHPDANAILSKLARGDGQEAQTSRARSVDRDASANSLRIAQPSLLYGWPMAGARARSAVACASVFSAAAVSARFA